MTSADLQTLFLFLREGEQCERAWTSVDRVECLSTGPPRCFRPSFNPLLRLILLLAISTHSRQNIEGLVVSDSFEFFTQGLVKRGIKAALTLRIALFLTPLMFGTGCQQIKKEVKRKTRRRRWLWLVVEKRKRIHGR